MCRAFCRPTNRRCDVAVMSLTSRTNRWASRVIIILQLATWNAVGIVLLHRGVSTLRRKILETNYVVEVIKSGDTNLQYINK